MPRRNGRAEDALREIIITKEYTKYAEGSCLIKCGDTWILCTATVEENVPSFLKNSGTGWVTAEYGMLPRACSSRVRRDYTSGRTYEIQRLIGRSLRSVIDLRKIGERTIKVDCDVLQADGGTRTAAITGGFVAMADAVGKLLKEHTIVEMPLTDYVAATSVGIVNKRILLDLEYEEDYHADMDMNVVMVRGGRFVEIQGTAEGVPFTKKQSDQLILLAQKGIEELIALQRTHLKGIAI